MKKVTANKSGTISDRDRVFTLVESIRVAREEQASLKARIEELTRQKKELENQENESQEEIVKLWKILDRPTSFQEPGTTVIVSPLEDKFEPQQKSFEFVSEDYLIVEEITTVKKSLNLEKIAEYVSKYKHTPKGIVASLDRHKVTIRNK